MYSDRLNRNQVAAIIQTGLDRLESLGDGVEAADLHHHLYNENYFIIGTHQAKEFMGGEAFDCIGIVQEYESDNFGEVSTDLSSPEKVVNMLAYIVGEEILQSSETLHDKWDETLTRDDLDAIGNEIREEWGMLS